MTRVRIVEFLLLLVAFGMTTEVFFKLDRAHTVRKEGVFFMRFFDGCVRVDDEEFCNAYTLDDYTRGCDDLEALGKNERVEVVLSREGIWPFTKTRFVGIDGPCRFIDNGPSCGLWGIQRQERIERKKWCPNCPRSLLDRIP